MKYLLKLICSTSLLWMLTACQSNASRSEIPYDDYTNFIVASDLGRNGYHAQKTVAEAMGNMADKIDAHFVACAGDLHHYMGVQSAHDPLWISNFEAIYKHPELQIEWYHVMGNHEYRGSAQAIRDYQNISRRWKSPSPYYSKKLRLKNDSILHVVFIDTPSLIDKYRSDTLEYPDVYKLSMEAQLRWIDSILNASPATWTVVVGHHPIYAETSKMDSERSDLQVRLLPLLEKYGVDIYFSGHIHNFQHIQMKDKKLHHVVNSSASKSRKVEPISGTQFCSDACGFTVCSANDKSLRFSFVNLRGEVIYVGG